MTLASANPTPPPRPTALGVALVVLGAIGLVTTLVPLLGQLTHTPLICGPFARCNDVLALAGSRWLGLPVAGWGVAAFAMILALAPRLPHSAWARGSVLALAGPATAISLLLQGRVHESLGTHCPWCLAAAGAMASIAGLTVWLHLRPAARRTIRARWVGWGAAAAVVFVAVEFSLMLQQH